MTRAKTALAATIVSGVAWVVPVLAQQSSMPGHAGSGHASGIMHQQMQQMQQDMLQHKLTDDPDQDWAAMMIRHHQGAIDMSKVVLEYGKDPEIRRMAEKVRDDQEKEIAVLRAWLQKHGQ